MRAGIQLLLLPTQMHNEASHPGCQVKSSAANVLCTQLLLSPLLLVLGVLLLVLLLLVLLVVVAHWKLLKA
jgi:hypothetical protein